MSGRWGNVAFIAALIIAVAWIVLNLKFQHHNVPVTYGIAAVIALVGYGLRYMLGSSSKS